MIVGPSDCRLRPVILCLACRKMLSSRNADCSILPSAGGDKRGGEGAGEDAPGYGVRIRLLDVFSFPYAPFYPFVFLPFVPFRGSQNEKIFFLFRFSFSFYLSV